jgi:drug/metabolite transporter (DMT)-like permease
MPINNTPSDATPSPEEVPHVVSDGSPSSSTSVSLGYGYSALAGICAALASVFGKLAFDSQVILTTISSSSVDSFLSSSLSPNGVTLEKLSYVLRALSFGLVIGTNALMMNFFVKSMSLTSSINATMINSSVNFFISAFLGCLLFGEALTMTWWIGGGFILIGLYVINHGMRREAREAEQKKKLK